MDWERAVWANDREFVDAHAATLLHKRTDKGYTPLILAAMYGRKALIEPLLGNARQTDNEGRTALMHACACGHADVARMLAKYEVTMRMNDGSTALHIATQIQNPELCSFLAQYETGIQNGRGETALILAAKGGASKLIPVLAPLECGRQDAQGWTALMHAASLCDDEVNDLLLDPVFMARNIKSVIPVANLWSKSSGADGMRYYAICEALMPYEVHCNTRGLLKIMRDVPYRNMYQDTLKYLASQAGELEEAIRRSEQSLSTLTEDARVLREMIAQDASNMQAARSWNSISKSGCSLHIALLALAAKGDCAKATGGADEGGSKL